MYIDLDSSPVSTEIRVKQIKRNAKMIPQSEISQTITAVKRKLVGEKKRKQTRVEPGKQYDDVCTLTTSSQANNKTSCRGCTFPWGLLGSAPFSPGHLGVPS